MDSCFCLRRGDSAASLWMVGNPFRCPIMEGLPTARHPTTISKHYATYRYESGGSHSSRRPPEAFL